MTYLKHKIAVMLIWWLCSSHHEESLNNGIFGTHFLLPRWTDKNWWDSEARSALFSQRIVKHTLGYFISHFCYIQQMLKNTFHFNPGSHPRSSCLMLIVMSCTSLSLRSCLQILRIRNWQRNLMTNILHTRFFQMNLSLLISLFDHVFVAWRAVGTTRQTRYTELYQTVQERCIGLLGISFWIRHYERLENRDLFI